VPEAVFDSEAGWQRRLTSSRMAGLLAEEAVVDLSTECLCHLEALAAEAVVLRHHSAGTGTVWEIAHTAMTLRRRTWRRLLDHHRHRHVAFHMSIQSSASTARLGQSFSDAGLQPAAASSKSAIFLVLSTSSLASQQTNHRVARRAHSHEL
jgi:hypothetical protein